MGFGKLGWNGPKSVGRITRLLEKRELRHDLGRGLKVRVPDTFQLDAISDARVFWTSRKINKLRVFNTSKHSNSPGLYQFKPSRSTV
jgi:hypothetical protein